MEGVVVRDLRRNGEPLSRNRKSADLADPAPDTGSTNRVFSPIDVGRGAGADFLASDYRSWFQSYGNLAARWLGRQSMARQGAELWTSSRDSSASCDHGGY